MKDIEETNEMLAEFIGLQKTDIGWYDNDEVMSEYMCHMVGGGNTFEELQFDRSFDWLMVVVAVIKDNSNGGTILIDDIDNALMNSVLSEVFLTVATFVEWYNEIK